MLILFTILVLNLPVKADLWGSGEAKERDRRQQAESRVDQMQKTNNGLEVVVLVLAVDLPPDTDLGGAHFHHDHLEHHQVALFTQELSRFNPRY
jgi:hypothetical protein